MTEDLTKEQAAKKTPTSQEIPGEPGIVEPGENEEEKGVRPLASILVIIVVAILGIVCLFLVQEPLGLFANQDITPIPELVTPVAVEDALAPEKIDWWHVYFTDPININDPETLEGSIQETLIQYIDSAEKAINIAAFEFNLTPVAAALISAQQRGVEVKWVTDDEHGIEADEEEDHGQFAMLEEAGIEVMSDDPSSLMHNKFIIFDGEIVWTGSTNLTENGIYRNNNNVIVIRSSEVAKMYELEFQEMWDGKFGSRSPLTLGRQWVIIDDIPVQVYFAAEDEVMDQFSILVEEARESLQFMTFSFTHSGLEGTISERFEDGVNVRGIFETRGSQTKYSAMPGLYCAGVPVRQDGNPRTFHHKVLVIDEEIVITGSMNFSENADDKNDENMLVIANPEIAALYLEEFDRSWAEATEPDPVEMNCE